MLTTTSRLERFRRSRAWGTREIDVAFGHGGDGGDGGDGGPVDLVAGFGSAGPGDGLITGEGSEEAEGHLGPAGVVGAEEQHGGLAVVVESFDFGQRLQPLTTEAFGDEGEELGDGGVVGELAASYRSVSCCWEASDPTEGVPTHGSVSGEPWAAAFAQPLDVSHKYVGGHAWTVDCGPIETP